VLLRKICGRSALPVLCLKKQSQLRISLSLALLFTVIRNASFPLGGT
jgi:hypothetical protein